MSRFFDPAYFGNAFIGATADYDAATAVIYGMPMDWTVSFRSGSRLGPKRIREVSIGLEEYSPYVDRELTDIRFADVGDLALPFGNPARSIEVIEAYVQELLDDGKIPVGLGGEHLVTWGPLRALHKRYPDLTIIHIDAHADLREHYEGEPYSHASVIRKAVDLVGADRVYQFGIRSGTREEFTFARENTRFFPFTVLEPLQSCLSDLKGKPLYVTIDIDVLDPACAPGTGTAEAGGILSAELLSAVHALRGQKIVGWDLVEVAPVIDPTEQTPIVAAKIIRESLLSWLP